MRRDGNLIDEIVDYANISSSFDQVLAGKKRKQSRQGRELIARREEFIADLQSRLRDGSFRILSGYRERDIVEGGKRRRIQVLTYADGIGVNAVMSVVDERIRNRLIRTTGASIRLRGTHDQKHIMERALRTDPEGTRYCYTFDIRKCYETTSQEWVKRAVRHIIKDRVLLPMLDSFIEMMPTGMSIGMRASQGLVNLLLSVYLDHRVKSQERFKWFFRYCDNGQFLCASKAECWRARDILHACLAPLGYEIHHERVFPSSLGIDALGYVISADRTRIRKRVKKRFARRMSDIKSRKRRKVLTASFYGMAKHAACSSLFYKLTKRSMKSFKDLNVTYTPADGKKRFRGRLVNISSLVNLPIIVRDYEKNVRTQYGDNRCLISIERGGELLKFFTASEEMIQALDQISNIPDGFPFETTIRASQGSAKYTLYNFS